MIKFIGISIRRPHTDAHLRDDVVVGRVVQLVVDAHHVHGSVGRGRRDDDLQFVEITNGPTATRNAQLPTFWQLANVDHTMHAPSWRLP